jgi:hypothetical protein
VYRYSIRSLPDEAVVVIGDMALSLQGTERLGHVFQLNAGKGDCHLYI